MAATIQDITLSVPDVSCEHCVKTIDGALGTLPGVETVSTDIRKPTGTGDDISIISIDWRVTNGRIIPEGCSAVFVASVQGCIKERHGTDIGGSASSFANREHVALARFARNISAPSWVQDGAIAGTVNVPIGVNTRLNRDWLSGLRQNRASQSVAIEKRFRESTFKTCLR